MVGDNQSFPNLYGPKPAVHRDTRRMIQPTTATWGMAIELLVTLGKAGGFAELGK